MFSLVTYPNNKYKNIFHNRQLLTKEQTLVTVDVPIETIKKAEFMWARTFIGNNDLGKYRRDYDIKKSDHSLLISALS